MLRRDGLQLSGYSYTTAVSTKLPLSRLDTFVFIFRFQIQTFLCLLLRNEGNAPRALACFIAVVVNVAAVVAVCIIPHVRNLARGQKTATEADRDSNILGG